MRMYKFEKESYKGFNIVDFASELNDLIVENQYLRQRVRELEEKEANNQQWIDRIYKNQQQNVADTLGVLINNLDK